MRRIIFFSKNIIRRICLISAIEFIYNLFLIRENSSNSWTVKKVLKFWSARVLE